MQTLIQLFGRFHPLLVHLPIGILFLAFIFEFASYFSKFKKLRQAVQPSLFVGALFSIAAVASGLILSKEGGYDDRILILHRNTGIATAVFTTLLYFLRKSAVTFFQDRGKRKVVRIFLFIPLVGLLSLTGHLGGSMTHGEGYLFSFDSEDQELPPKFKVLSASEADTAIYYVDVIEPILRSRCYSCHSSSKQKGQLRLDRPEFITKGGKHGVIINTVTADSSELLKRLMLPFEDEHHMPSNEKPQPSSSEIALIQAWLEEGASFDNRLGTFKQVSKIKGYLNSVLSQSIQKTLIPDVVVQEADQKAVSALRALGVLVIPVGAETNYLSVNFVNARSATDKELALLLPLKNQLLWLNVGRTNITDEGLKTIGQLSNLAQLNLEYTKIGDPGLEQLIPLKRLTILKLVGTQVTNKGLVHIGRITNLDNVYLYQTDVTSEGVGKLMKDRPKLEIDTGGYEMPRLVTDTLIFKGKS
ncbi:MAG TPA: DUF2231 domain-containing protein [Chryseolinea sp.]|nr:DUF2231 domain-containing protein [Chryseolinea sp.]